MHYSPFGAEKSYYTQRCVRKQFSQQVSCGRVRDLYRQLYSKTLPKFVSAVGANVVVEQVGLIRLSDAPF